jgi:cbb3-type cytochrome oxidase cytochrome c subunit
MFDYEEYIRKTCPWCHSQLVDRACLDPTGTCYIAFLRIIGDYPINKNV